MTGMHLTLLFHTTTNVLDRSVLFGSGLVPLPEVDARRTGAVKFSLKDLPKQTNGELWLTLCIQLRSSASWAEAGHIINICQTKLESPTRQEIAYHEQILERLDIQESRASYRISGSGFSVLFDRVRGNIHDLIVRGSHVIQANGSDAYSDALCYGLWRPPTDNDKAWQAAEWRNFGLDTMTTTLLSCELLSQTDRCVTIRCVVNLMPPILAWGLRATYDTTITGSGLISIKTQLSPFGPAPKTLPRIGHNIQLSPDLVTVKWFGLGPGESYNDKCLAQQVSIHSSVWQDLQIPYDVPQENGNRAETRWLEVSNGGDLRIRISYKPGSEEREYFQWAMLRHDDEVVEKAAHPCDLVARKGPLLRLDCDHAGLGTAACGPGPKLSSQVMCREREFEFLLKVL